MAPKRSAERAHLVGDHERSGRQLARPALERLARRSGRAARGAPVDLVGVEGAQGDAGLDDRDRERVVEQVLALEAALLHPVERQLLDRRQGLVGVEADVAEEDAVGPRDRLLAQRDRLRRRRSGRRARAGAPSRPRGLRPEPRSTTSVAEAEARELLGELGRDRAAARLAVALRRARRSASRIRSSIDSLTGRSRPLLRLGDQLVDPLAQRLRSKLASPTAPSARMPPG